MKQSFITSYLTFYLKASVSLEGNFIKTSNPNTILKLIPLGSINKTIPIEQISSVNDSFKMDFKSFLWGIVFLVIGFNQIGMSLVSGGILLFYAVLTILSSFQTILEINLASGNSYYLNVVIFQKSKLLSCKDTIESLINKRYDNTNVTANTDRIIEHLKK